MCANVLSEKKCVKAFLLKICEQMQKLLTFFQQKCLHKFESQLGHITFEEIDHEIILWSLSPFS